MRRRWSFGLWRVCAAALVAALAAAAGVGCGDADDAAKTVRETPVTESPPAEAPPTPLPEEIALVASPEPSPPPRPVRVVRTNAERPGTAILLGTAAREALDALEPLAENAREIPPGAAVVAGAKIVLGREADARCFPVESLRDAVASGALLFVDAWRGDEAWLLAFAPEGKLRPLTETDAVLARPSALKSLPPAHASFDATIVGIEVGGVVRVIATKQDTLCHQCGCERAGGRRAFGENLAQFAIETASAAANAPWAPVAEVTGATMRDGTLRVTATVRNPTERVATARLRVLRREGPPLAETSKALPPGAGAELELTVPVPPPFDVLEHRLVASREDELSVDRVVEPLLPLVGAADLILLDTRKVVPGLPAAVRLLARNSLTGAPLEGLPVEMRLGRDAELVGTGRGRTDAAGTVALAIPVPESMAPETPLRWTAVLTGPAGEECVESGTKTVETVGEHLLLDLPVHRPGDKVKFRLLAQRQPSGRAAAGWEAHVSLCDRDSRRKAQCDVRTDATGVAVGELQIPSDAATGDWHVETDRTGRAALRVERFETPRFKVVLDAPDRRIRPGAALAGSVTARRFDDCALAGAEVSVALRAPDLSSPPLARWEGLTDAQGRVAWRLDAASAAGAGSEPRSRDGGDLLLLATVVDAGGRSVTESVRVARPGGLSAGSVEVYAPDGPVLPMRPATVLLRTDAPPGATVTATVADEGPQTRVADEFGFVEIDLREPWRGTKIHVGETIVRPSVAADGLALSVGHRVVAAGAAIPVRAEVDANANADAVLVDLLWQETIVATHRLRVVQGFACGDLVLPAGVSGRVTVQAYLPPKDDRRDTVARGLFVVPPETLRLSLQPSAAEVRPGDPVALDVQVTDLAGRGVASAVALRVADEAVLSLVDRPIDSARAALALDRFLLRALRDEFPWQIADLVGLAAGRGLSRAEMRIADVAMSRRDVPVSYGAVTHSLPSRVASAEVRVREQFGRFGSDFVRRAHEVLGGDLAPPPSDQVGDVGTALRVAAAHGAFGPDGLLDPWGTPLALAGGRLCPRDAAGPERSEEFEALVLSSFGPDGEADAARVTVRALRTARHAEVADDVGYEVSLEDLVDLHARWVRRHGRTFDDEAALRGALRIGVGGGAGGAFGGRRGGHRSLSAGGTSKMADALAEAEGPRVRRFFPEAILFAPLVETDTAGRARIEITTPDSVTAWRADGIAHAVAPGGPGGVAQADARFRTTLPFVADADAPSSLWKGDEAAIPVVLRWNGAARSDVVVEATASGPLEILPPARTVLQPGARGEAAAFVKVRGTGHGPALLTVRCLSGGRGDAIERAIQVRMPGRDTAAVAVLRSASGPASARLVRPKDVVPGSERLEMRLRRGPLDDVLDGVAGLVKMPHGCFEQASSTLFPDILALSYLDRFGQIPDATRGRFDEAIREGTRLLLSYEIEGGGFDWFGRPPAKLLLSAYGAHEWWMLHRLRRREGKEDPRGSEGAGAVAMRTTRWLVAQQRADGSFPAEGVPYEWRDGRSSELAATAYVGWAIAQGRRWDASFDDAVVKARRYVLAKTAGPDAADGGDPYVLALAALFLAEAGDDPEAAACVAERLAKLVRFDGDRAWVDGGRGSAIHGRGSVASVEATALAVLAARRLGDRTSLPLDAFLDTIREKRRADGTWGTTQATVLALWAMLDAREDAPPAGTEIVVRAPRLPERRVTVGDDAAPVTVDLQPLLAAGPGPYAVTVERNDGGPVSATLRMRYSAAWPARGEGSGSVSVRAPLPQRATVGETFAVPVEVRNTSNRRVAMPTAVIPLPAGVSVPRAALRALVRPDGIERIETEDGRAVLYLRTLGPGASVSLSLPVVARLRGRLVAAPPEASPYYEPDAVVRGGASVVVVE